MAYSTSLPGVREAIATALMGLMTAKMGDLAAALTGITPALTMSYNGRNVTPSASTLRGMFYRGDFDTLPDPATNPFWVTVDSGGRQDGTDAEYEGQATGGDHRSQFWTNIYWYLHPEVFPTAVATDQALSRTLLRDRFHDWMIGDVLNTNSAQGVTLASQQFSPGTFDKIGQAKVKRVIAEVTGKGPGKATDVFRTHFCHWCEIYGPY